MLARKVRPVPSLAVLLAAVLPLTGCSDKKAPETTAPPGFTVVKDASAGFAVAVPADWTQIPLLRDIDAFDKKAHELQGANPNLGPAVIQARQLAQSGGRLMAVSADGKSIVNLTVDKTKEKTLAQIGAAVSKSLTDNGATDLTQAPATTGAGPALRLTFKYPIPGTGDNPTIADEVQYYALKGGRSFVLTFINPPADLPDAVAATFKLR
jgi:hypothetical protein